MFTNDARKQTALRSERFYILKDWKDGGKTNDIFWHYWLKYTEGSTIKEEKSRYRMVRSQ